MLPAARSWDASMGRALRSLEPHSKDRHFGAVRRVRGIIAPTVTVTLHQNVAQKWQAALRQGREVGAHARKQK